MSTRDNGGPIPGVWTWTLRDWFAGMIVQPVLGTARGLSTVSDEDLTKQFDELARWSYMLADAMLRERAK